MARIDMMESGTSGLKQFSGFVQEAYNRALYWPSVQPLYSRLRRSDPEISIVRNIFTSMARGVDIVWELPDNASDDDKKAQEFAEQVTRDMEGGASQFIDTIVSQVPFFGWGWWEVLPGVRQPDWKSPDGDDWRSEYNDGRIGIRRMAWRDTSSFYGWDIDNKGRLFGLKQHDWPNPPTTIPLEKSLHLTIGDAHNPEGLSPLEAVWRLERIKYGLEVVQGIGFEHSAGYLNITTDKTLTPADKADVKAAAKAIMTAMEGNYAAFPAGVVGEVKDTAFSAAPSILEAIRYFGLMKLMVFNMQWVAMATIARTGAFSAVQDSSSMFLTTYNAMLDGFAQQIDNQIGKRLFTWNAGAFPGMTKRPTFKFSAVGKEIDLDQLGRFVQAMGFDNLGEDDWIAIRKRSGFLPETLPELNSMPDKPQEPDAPQSDKLTDNKANSSTPDKAEMERRTVQVSPEELPDDVQGEADVTEQDVKRAMNKFERWAAENDPEFAKLLKAKAKKR
jgi:hypothetical protein